MASMKPFKAFRPKKGLEDKIAALPYDVYSREEAKFIVDNNPHSFLKVDRAETTMDDSVDSYDESVYKKAKELLEEMIQTEEFIQEEKAVYYIYELTMFDRKQTGLVALSSIDDYLNQTIKKHENTRADKELDRIKHVSVLEAQTGPIFLAYRKNDTITSIIKEKKEEPSLYDFVAKDHVRHRVWVIDDLDDIQSITNTFQQMNQIYIADGHHRCASAVKVGQMLREKNHPYTGEEEFNYFLSVLFPDEELKIMSYNRVVKDLNGLSKEKFLTEIQDAFCIGDVSEKQMETRNKTDIGMYLDGKWYMLSVKEEKKSKDPVDSLDVALLQNYILGPILNIDDPTTNERIGFVGGIRGLDQLELLVNTDWKVAFAMYPTSIDELFLVADAGKLMPPKSTWFEPKLRSGLFIHSIK